MTRSLSSTPNPLFFCLVLFDFLTSSSATRLNRGQVSRLTSDNLTCSHTRDRAVIMMSVSAGHIILTPTQPEGIRRPQRGSTLAIIYYFTFPQPRCMSLTAMIAHVHIHSSHKLPKCQSRNLRLNDSRQFPLHSLRIL